MIRDYFFELHYRSERTHKGRDYTSESRPRQSIQTSLFSAIENNQESSALMSAMDAINAKFGKETIKLASSGIERKWTLKAEMRSPRYTTVWDDLPIVKAADMSCFA